MSAPRPAEREPGRPDKFGFVRPTLIAIPGLIVGGVAEVTAPGTASVIWVWFFRAVVGP